MVKRFKKYHTSPLSSSLQVTSCVSRDFPYQTSVHYIMQVVGLELRVNPVIPGHRFHLSSHKTISPKLKVFLPHGVIGKVISERQRTRTEPAFYC